MAGATRGAGLLKSGTKGSLVASISRRLQGTKLGQHIRIGRFKAGPICPNGRQGAGVPGTTPRRETRRKAIKKTDHFGDGGGGGARVTPLIHYGLDTFHLARNALQAIAAGGNHITLRPGRGRDRKHRDNGGGEFPGFLGVLQNPD